MSADDEKKEGTPANAEEPAKTEPWLAPSWAAEVALAPEYLTVIDEELRMLFINKVQEGLGDVRGKSMLEFLPPSEHEECKSVAAEMFRSQLPQRRETKAAGPDGRETVHSGWFVPFPSQDGRRLAVTLGSDISEQRRVELELRSTNSMLRAVFEHAPVTLMVIDSQHRIEYINRLTDGYTLEQILGLTPEEFLQPEDGDRVRDVIDGVFKSGESSEYDASVAIPLPNGQLNHRHYSTRVALIRDEEHPKAVLVVLEITAERNAEAALKESESQLRQAQKMEAVGQLTGGVSHDFNNLLTVIMGSVHLAVDRVEDPLALECLKDALEAAERAAALTARLLAFSRKQALHPAPIDVQKLFVGLDPLFRRTVREELDLKLHCDNTERPCFADVHQLENALLNLVLNAKDAIDGVGTIQVSAQETEVEAGSEMAKNMSPGHYWQFSVIDNGDGMTQEQVSHAFEPFFTTKEVGKGSGLGLSMVYGFAKQSGGHAFIENNDGGGVSVVLLLPIDE